MTNLFEALYGSCETGWLSTWVLQDKKTRWYPVKDYDQALKEGLQLAQAKAYDIYFGVGLREKNLGQWKRGHSETITTIPALWVDIDIAGESHKKTSLPPTLEAAVKLLEEFPLWPSALIHSGYGLHGYWILKEPWEFESSEERLEAQHLLKSLEQTIRYYAAQKGWDIDPTADLARVLRIPGTFNHKQNKPKEVKLLDLNDYRYNPSDFEDYIIDGQISFANRQQGVKSKTHGNSAAAGSRVAGSEPGSAGKTNHGAAAAVPTSAAHNHTNKDYDYGPATLILENCYFIKHCQEKPATLSEPEWYAMISNVARGDGGRDLAHELSKPYPGYSQMETNKKIDHALNNGYPHTCEYIQQELGFECPENGAMCIVTAPVGHCLSKLTEAKSKINTMDIDKDNAFTPEIIGALAVLKKDDPISYANIKQELKGKVNLVDLEKAVKHQMMKNQKLYLIEKQGQAQLLDDIMPNIPLKNLRLPYQWSFTDKGIWQMKKIKAGEVEGVCASPVPVILTKRLRNIDTGEEKVELSYYRDKQWHYITASRATVFNRQGLIQLGNRGLPVSSENAKYLVEFLFDLEKENLDLLPVIKSASHMGWVGAKKFLPGAGEDIRLDVDEGSGTASIAAGYRQEGTLEEWIAIVKKVRVHPIARFMLAASFAAPLLEVVSHRVFIIHAWGPSRGGKTAALKTALSVWGNPEELITSFNATRVGLERMASFYSDLPLGIDERQVVGDKQGLVESLVYLLGTGKGKARGTKGGGLQQITQWRTIVLTTGEEPLSSSSSAGGVKTRAVELYGLPIRDESLAMRLHETTKEVYGTAGPVFIEKLIQEITQRPSELKNDYEKTKQTFMENSENITSHITALALVCLADYYASRWIFNLDEIAAAEEATALARSIKGMLESSAEADDTERSWEYVCGWLASNKEKFKENALPPQYGYGEKNLLYVLPDHLKAALRDAGFSPERVLKDFAEKELIHTFKEAGKVRYTTKKMWNGQRPRFIVLTRETET